MLPTISHGLKHYGAPEIFNRDRRDDAGPRPVRLRGLPSVLDGLVGTKFKAGRRIARHHLQ